MISTQYLVNTIGMMAIGIMVANIILETNLLSKFTSPMRFLWQASNLPESCMMSVLACMINPTMGKSTLAGFFRRGEVSGTQTTLTILLTSFPIILGEALFGVQAPMAIVLLGPAIGGAYVALNLFSAFLQSFTALIISKIMLPSQKSSSLQAESAHLDLSKKVFIRGFKKAMGTLKTTIPAIILAMVVIDILMSFGLMDALTAAFDPLLHLLGLPGMCMAPLSMQLVNYTAGFAAVASLFNEGALTGKQVLIVLFLGNMLATTMIYLRYSISMYL